MFAQRISFEIEIPSWESQAGNISQTPCLILLLLLPPPAAPAPAAPPATAAAAAARVTPARVQGFRALGFQDFTVWPNGKGSSPYTQCISITVRTKDQMVKDPRHHASPPPSHARPARLRTRPDRAASPLPRCPNVSGYKSLRAWCQAVQILHQARGAPPSYARRLAARAGTQLRPAALRCSEGLDSVRQCEIWCWLVLFCQQWIT